MCFQIDIPNSIVNFLEEELPQLLKGMGEEGQVLLTSNNVTPSTGAESFDCLPVCCLWS
jgi:hypothetical protein